MKCCVIGAGTFGSYLAKALVEDFPEAEVTVLEAGGERTADEREAGFRSSVSRGRYAGLSEGRFFGLGGSSARWGGQLLWFEPEDFASPDALTRDIVAANVAHRARVLRRLGLAHLESEIIPGSGQVAPGVRTKRGVWLSYRRRNLFRALGVAELPRVRVLTGCRVLGVEQHVGKVEAVRYVRGGLEQTEQFEHFFLCAGAFETTRLLARSGLLEAGEVAFSDHVSQRAFELEGPPEVGAVDFRFRVRRGSLLTTRLVGEVGDVSYFAHPIFNERFAFFQELKQLLFRRRFSLALFASLITGLPAALAFAFELLVRRRLYVHRRRWALQIDLEAPRGSGSVSEGPALDAAGQPELRASFVLPPELDAHFSEARRRVRGLLDDAGVRYREVSGGTSEAKYEDTYHPFGMLSGASSSLDEHFARFPNLLVVSTGVLPRAGSINCTAALFPVIEAYLERVLRPQSANAPRLGRASER
jgi:hypothetical protein